MNTQMESLENRYRERYQAHDILSEDVLNDEKEAQFFTDVRKRLKQVRKELKMTQREFGESSGIDRRYVAKVECGSQNPSFKFLRCISIKHKISLDWLLYGIGDKYVAADEGSYGEDLIVFRKLLDNASQDDIDVVMKMIKRILG